MQDHKSLCVVTMTWANLVNRHTERQLSTSFISRANKMKKYILNLLNYTYKSCYNIPYTEETILFKHTQTTEYNVHAHPEHFDSGG